MASLDEIALGIATALAGVAPEPLPVQLRGQTIDQAAYLVRTVSRECADAGIVLRRIKVDAELFRFLSVPGAPALGCPLAGGGHPAEVLFFRSPTTSTS
jgi:hypothetical protein